MRLKSVMRAAAPVLLRFLHLRFGLTGALALVASVSASADTMTATTDAYGNITTFATGTSISITASQFDQTAINAAITGACPSGYFCSPATLVGIDEMFTANLTGTITVANSSGIGYIAAIQRTSPNYTGIFGNPNSGVALTQTVSVSLTDPYQSGAANASPVQTVSTNRQFKGSSAGSGTCGTQGIATSPNYVNCRIFSNTGNTAITNSKF